MIRETQCNIFHYIDSLIDFMSGKYEIYKGSNRFYLFVVYIVLNGIDIDSLFVSCNQINKGDSV